MALLRQRQPCSRRAAVSCSAQAVRFRPCIDIHQGKVKQIVGSTLKDLPSSSSSGSSSGGDPAELRTNFVSDKPSSWFAELYRRDALPGGHVIMLGADDASRQTALEALRAWPGGLQLGGGVSTSNAGDYLDAGASHVIVTSFVFREGRFDEERLDALVKQVGKARLVLDLSCRRRGDGGYYVVTDRWQRFSSLRVDAATLEALASRCDEFLVHGVDVEGMQLGIDDDLVSLLGEASPIPVTYAGGARTLEDLDRVAAAGRGRVDITVGSALDVFGGKLPYADVVAWHKAQAARAPAGPPAAPENAAMVFMGIHGGPSRCYNFWMDFQECMHESATEPLKCKALADDYLECLHHRKYYERQLTIERERRRQEAEAAAGGKAHH
ncbi:HISN3 [Scenedesmus sp. PABB004]|nr:HISN3 [Scenedesmus sp. PABB004]